jgi:hypothetical protein
MVERRQTVQDTAEETQLGNGKADIARVRDDPG